ncbi:methylenetetrahydrofolate reductase [Microbacterium sp. KSW4-11]|uniref:Methylenetetrahydrofolate reductase n=1 Tax=Microbacterium gawkjiense TaxID=3067309 RepID=A0ABU3G5Z7_9MICO|nr:methylenetetrahydrofolate reductase [Microbacterium sp. KSW4-11]MDT3315232.1 methylenetetrahydrofolate reductase [Microbacterium sp. KSW4-11]
MSIIQPPSVTTVPVSFEVYPPRSDASYAALYETIDRLAAVDPAFISVTYGAGGSGGGRSLEVLTHILRETRVEPLAHLTCIGSSYAEATALIREFLDAGIRSFLALRGDPPVGAGEDAAALGDLESAAQLVQLIDRVQAETSPYTEEPIPGVPGAARVERRPSVDIAVAAFPNGHPRSRYPAEHIDALLAKQAAGATLAITQLFFHADDYLAFVARARSAGVEIPILPGIMPITSPSRLRRVIELTGEQVPGTLAVDLDVEPTADGRREIGVRYAADLCRAVLAGGAPGIHLYAFNNHDTVLATLREAGIIPPTEETS